MSMKKATLLDLPHSDQEPRLKALPDALLIGPAMQPPPAVGSGFVPANRDGGSDAAAEFSRVSVGAKLLAAVLVPVHPTNDTRCGHS